jgi:acid phosphatase type 7
MKKSMFVSLALLLITVSPAWSAIAKGPYLQRVTENEVTVCVEGGLFDRLPGRVEWGTDSSLGNVVNGSGNRDRHEITITGLQPGTEYYYKFVYGNETSPTVSFFTAPSSGEPFEFFVIGDTRTQHDIHTQICNAVLNNPYHRPKLLINTGDLVNLGINILDWETFFNVERELMSKVVMYPTFGNHELGGDAHWGRFFILDDPHGGTEKYYSFRYGSVQFIVIDSNTLALDPVQQRWLEAALQRASADPNVQHIVPSLHHPVFSSSKWGSNIPVQNIVKPLFEQHGVQLVLTGHDHLYQHCPIDGIHYMVLGGGGAPLYSYRDEPWVQTSVKDYHYCIVEVDGNQMTFSAYLRDHSLIETFTITSSQPTPIPTATPTVPAETPTPGPTATPVPTPFADVAIDIFSTVTPQGTDQQTLTMGVRISNNDTEKYDVSLYIVLAVGGNYYYYPSFSPHLSPVAEFPMNAGYDTGAVSLFELPTARPIGPLPLTWYGALINLADGKLLGDVAMAQVTLE